MAKKQDTNQRRVIQEHIGEEYTAYGTPRFNKEELSYDGYSIDDIIKKLKQIKKEHSARYPDGITLDRVDYYEYGDTYTKIHFLGKRMETDEEMQARLDKERAARLEREQQDRLEYDRLRARFEK